MPINEPTPQNNPNLPEDAKLTLRVIALETALERYQIVERALNNTLHDFETRLSVLEEARVRQIALNATFATKEPTKSVEKLDKPNPISFLQSPHWNFWK